MTSLINVYLTQFVSTLISDVTSGVLLKGKGLFVCSNNLTLMDHKAADIDNTVVMIPSSLPITNPCHSKYVYINTKYISSAHIVLSSNWQFQTERNSHNDK